MPNMCANKIRRVKLVHKPSPEVTKLKSKKDKVNRLLTNIRSKYIQLDEEFRQLMELQSSLMVKKYKIDAKTPLTFKAPIPSTSGIKKFITKDQTAPEQDNKDVINKTKLNLQSGTFNFIAKEEEEDEDST